MIPLRCWLFSLCDRYYEVRNDVICFFVKETINTMIDVSWSMPKSKKSASVHGRGTTSRLIVPITLPFWTSKLLIAILSSSHGCPIGPIILSGPLTLTLSRNANPWTQNTNNFHEVPIPDNNGQPKAKDAKLQKVTHSLIIPKHHGVGTWRRVYLFRYKISALLYFTKCIVQLCCTVS